MKTIKQITLILLLISYSFTFSQNITITVEIAKKIGIAHNNYLSQAFTNKNLDSVKNHFIKIVPKELTSKETNTIINYFETTNNVDLEKEINKLLKTDKSKEYFLKIKNIIKKQENENVFNQLDNVLTQINKNLLKDEKSILILFTEVTKSSIKFWSKSINQQNLTDFLYGNNTFVKVNWENVIVADAMGAVGGFLRFGISPLWPLGGPASVGALISIVGWSAGWASATTLLWELGK